MNETRKKPVNFDQLYPGRFLKAGSLVGKKVTLTIKDADVEVLEGEKGPAKKAIISFVETDMSLVACKTNGLSIKAMFGPEITNWVGKRITLFPGTWNGEDCIRIWGSPDIERDKDVVIALPRRKPFNMTMHRVERQAAGEGQRPLTPSEQALADSLPVPAAG